MTKGLLLAGVSALALAAAASAARADNIFTNQWYTAHFTVTPSPLLGGTPYALGTNGPILPAGNFQATADNAPATAGGLLSAVITLPKGGYLTVTDVQESGDQYMMDVNGVPATPAPASATGLVPSGQNGLAGGLTSVPAPNNFVSENISAALSDPNFSSGTFFLPAGSDTITGSHIVGVGLPFSDVNLIVEPATAPPPPVPEPATLSLLGVGLAGVGLARRRKRRAPC